LAEKPRKATPMKIRRCLLSVRDESGIHSMVTMDVIAHEGKFWLVPEWLDNQTKTATRPVRIVSLETMVHHRTEGQNPEFLVENPIPTYVFDGQIPPAEASKYVVVEYPGILIRRDGTLN
jgi:hypothetical protein